jgi:hypothetical protein
MALATLSKNNAKIKECCRVKSSKSFQQVDSTLTKERKYGKINGAA